MPIFLILRSKIKKMGIHSLFSFAAAGGESLLRQSPKTLPAVGGALRRTADRPFRKTSSICKGGLKQLRVPYDQPACLERIRQFECLQQNIFMKNATKKYILR
jgi:hypothetical protein